jgi:hypothetical protein
VFAQGEDSETFDRDLQVIVTMIAGGFDNANQSYFDSRGKKDIRHRRLHVEVKAVEAAEIGEFVFLVSAYWDNEKTAGAFDQLWVFTADAQSRSVRMRAWKLDGAPSADSALSLTVLSGKAHCDLLWRRESTQFRASGDKCDVDLPSSMLLSDRHLWMTLGDVAANGFQMHRIRNFECYADIPGVGGGRDEPYERYEGFKIHDQGGAVWFDSKDGRRLRISLFLADWPINNYKGIFTRDSFVIYVSEDIDGVIKEHGYAFTVPEADRIGINLKWILASCFMKSNKFATPYM